MAYADLSVIDLAKAGDAEGRAELAAQVCAAMQTHGFFYVINHGYTSEQASRCTFRRDSYASDKLRSTVATVDSADVRHRRYSVQLCNTRRQTHLYRQNEGSRFISRVQASPVLGVLSQSNIYLITLVKYNA